MAEPKEMDVYIWPDHHVVEVDVVLKRVAPPVMSPSRVVHDTATTPPADA